MPQHNEIRLITEEHEKEHLAPYATRSSASRGRLTSEETCQIRTAYQRDRDRIIHSEFFRKLKGKTQVFIQKHEFYRSRLTHTLEVSQIARTIARALRLNEDLIEAIALGHDLGHTCFGHSGEEVLDRLTSHFAHNEQSLRVVDVLENSGRGLNLTYEVRDGILNHTGEGIPLTMEGKLVKIADRITYLCHDIQDSISAGIITEADIPDVFKVKLGSTHSQRVNTFVKDMVLETAHQLGAGNELRIYQTPEITHVMHELRKFMFHYVYNGDVCMHEKVKAAHIVEFLYRTYTQELPAKDAVDLISGFTDGMAIKEFQDRIIPKPK